MPALDSAPPLRFTNSSLPFPRPYKSSCFRQVGHMGHTLFQPTLIIVSATCSYRSYCSLSLPPSVSPSHNTMRVLLWSNHPEVTRTCPVVLFPPSSQWFEEVRCGPPRTHSNLPCGPVSPFITVVLGGSVW